jgi:2-methylcitrate dehydratase PrpD
LPYLIAAALVHGRVGIEEVADIHNVQVLDVAAFVTGVAVERYTSDKVAITLRDGLTATATVGLTLGSPGNRLSMEQLTMKSVDCAANAARQISDETVHAAIHMIAPFGRNAKS